LHDGHAPTREIDVLPAQTERFASPQAGGQHEHPKWAQAIVRRLLEKAPSLLGAPRIDRVRRHPRQVEAGLGWIRSKEMPVHRLAQRLPENLMGETDRTGAEAAAPAAPAGDRKICVQALEDLRCHLLEL
jgi:hypothetical protein